MVTVPLLLLCAYHPTATHSDDDQQETLVIADTIVMVVSRFTMGPRPTADADPGKPDSTASASAEAPTKRARCHRNLAMIGPLSLTNV
jgi:hypothetical protein